MSNPRRQDRSALLIPVPAAEPAVRAWRGQFDPSAAAGVPAHITLLVPFMPREDIADGDVTDLRAHFASARAFGRGPLNRTLPNGPVR